MMVMVVNGMEKSDMSNMGPVCKRTSKCQSESSGSVASGFGIFEVMGSAAR